MNDLTKEEAIGRATAHLAGMTGFPIQYCREHARDIWEIYSRVKPAAPPMPPKPELTCWRVRVGRDAGIIFWATTSELGVLRDTKTGDVIAEEFCEKVLATKEPA